MGIHVVFYCLLYLLDIENVVEFLSLRISSDREIRVAYILDLKGIFQIRIRDIEDEVHILEGHPSIDVLGILGRCGMGCLILEQEVGNRSMIGKGPASMSGYDVAHEEYGKYRQQSDDDDREDELERSDFL